MGVADAGDGSKRSRLLATGERKDAASAVRLAKRVGLNLVSADSLSIRRLRHGRGFRYVTADGAPIRDPQTVARLKSLAVPPAYENVVFSEDPRAHLQAVGRDAAGRLQYRYHPDWDKVREMRKARRLAALAEALPRIRRSVARHLAGTEPTREFALAAVIELVALSAIRAGGEAYARMNGSRGATTLLKSNVSLQGDETLTFGFRAKGGQEVRKELQAPRLCRVVTILARLPGRRLFQYRTETGDLRAATARDVNAFLREIAGARISLKDFRTLLASVTALDALAREAPAQAKRARRRQVLEAIRAAAADLANTPATCAKSYVHDSVVNAFEEGVLERFAETLRTSSPAQREKVLAKLVAQAGA